MCKSLRVLVGCAHHCQMKRCCSNVRLSDSNSPECEISNKFHNLCLSLEYLHHMHLLPYQLFSTARGFTPEEEAYFEASALKFYTSFITKAAASRNMTVEGMHEVRDLRQLWGGGGGGGGGGIHQTLPLLAMILISIVT